MRLIPLLASALVLGLTGSPHVGARPAPTISVVPSDVSLSVGETQQLVATVRAASGVAVSRAAVVWSSSNPALAAVSGSGVVTAVAPGRAGITAASG
ncbi:MAG: Ig-like domain-containing protein, partial [Gemmatimonadaceae bacterium]